MTVISSWTEEREATLARLWADGYSCRQIAIELGSVTRNGVIGKVYRMGLSAPVKKRVFERKPRERQPREKLPSHSIHRVVRANGNSNAMRVISVTERTAYRLRCVEIECSTSFEDLEGCRYPVGDGPFLFCNGPKIEGKSYCLPHAAICFEAPRVLTTKTFVREVA